MAIVGYRYNGNLVRVNLETGQLSASPAIDFAVGYSDMSVQLNQDWYKYSVNLKSRVVNGIKVGFSDSGGRYKLLINDKVIYSIGRESQCCLWELRLGLLVPYKLGDMSVFIFEHGNGHLLLVLDKNNNIILTRIESTNGTWRKVNEVGSDNVFSRLKMLGLVWVE